MFTDDSTIRSSSVPSKSSHGVLELPSFLQDARIFSSAQMSDTERLGTDFRVHPFTLHFPDPSVEQQFTDYLIGKKNSARVNVVVLVGIAVMILYASLDSIEYEGSWVWSFSALYVILIGVAMLVLLNCCRLRGRLRMWMTEIMFFWFLTSVTLRASMRYGSQWVGHFNNGMNASLGMDFASLTVLRPRFLTCFLMVSVNSIGFVTIQLIVNLVIFPERALKPYFLILFVFGDFFLLVCSYFIARYQRSAFWSLYVSQRRKHRILEETNRVKRLLRNILPDFFVQKVLAKNEDKVGDVDSDEDLFASSPPRPIPPPSPPKRSASSELDEYVEDDPLSSSPGSSRSASYDSASVPLIIAPYAVQRFDYGSVVLCDLVGFTGFAAVRSPFQVIETLNVVYGCFDSLTDAVLMGRVKTIGDAFLAVGGLGLGIGEEGKEDMGEFGDCSNVLFGGKRSDSSVLCDAILLGIAMLSALDLVNQCPLFGCSSLAANDLLNDVLQSEGERKKRPPGLLHLRVGVFGGETVLAVLGSLKTSLSFELVGSSFHTVKELEASSLEGHVQVKRSVAERLGDEIFRFERRSDILLAQRMQEEEEEEEEGEGEEEEGAKYRTNPEEEGNGDVDLGEETKTETETKVSFGREDSDLMCSGDESAILNTDLRAHLLLGMKFIEEFLRGYTRKKRTVTSYSHSYSDETDSSSGFGRKTVSDSTSFEDNSSMVEEVEVHVSDENGVAKETEAVGFKVFERDESLKGLSCWPRFRGWCHRTWVSDDLASFAFLTYLPSLRKETKFRLSELRSKSNIRFFVLSQFFTSLTAFFILMYFVSECFVGTFRCESWAYFTLQDQGMIPVVMAIVSLTVNFICFILASVLALLHSKVVSKPAFDETEKTSETADSSSSTTTNPSNSSEKRCWLDLCFVASVFVVDFVSLSCLLLCSLLLTVARYNMIEHIYLSILLFTVGMISMRFTLFPLVRFLFYGGALLIMVIREIIRQQGFVQSFSDVFFLVVMITLINYGAHMRAVFRIRAYESDSKIREQKRMLLEEKNNTRRLVLSVVPEHAYRQAMEKRKTFESFLCCTVFVEIPDFCDLVDHDLELAVQFLAALYDSYDGVLRHFGNCVKIKSIEGLYLFVVIADDMTAGAYYKGQREVLRLAFQDALEIAHCIVETFGDMVYRYRCHHSEFPRVTSLTGGYVGRVAAGICGSKRCTYDVLGDTCNMAYRLTHSGVSGAFHVVTDQVELFVNEEDSRWEIENRGCIELKGRGEFDTSVVRFVDTGSGSEMSDY